MKRDFSRVALVMGVALLVPACHDSDGGGGSSALFSDQFERQAVGSEWSTAGAAGSAAIVQDDGQSALSMSVSQPNETASAETTMSFPGRPLTFTVDQSAFASGAGFGGAQIVDNGGAVVASAEQFAGVGGGYTFAIGGDTQTFPSGGTDGFQTLSFQVDAQGNGTWLLDGAQVMTRSNVPNVPLRLRLFTRGDDVPPGSASFPTFNFDNILVTSP